MARSIIPRFPQQGNGNSPTTADGERPANADRPSENGDADTGTDKAANRGVQDGASTGEAGTEARPGQMDSADESAAALIAAELAAHRRRWPFLVVGLALGAVAAYGVVTYFDRSTDSDSGPVEAVALATAPVESRDLIEEVEWTGSLIYGDPLTIAGSTGTITGSVPAGTEIGRGDVVAAVDGQPVVAFYGTRPLWRSMNEGVEGLDVLLLESNLVALGYDPDVTVSVDQLFTTNTALMVERWQEDIGREVTGTVSLADVVVMSGPGVVTSEGAVGSEAAAGLGTVSASRTTTDVVSGLEGLVTEPLPVGSEVVAGTTLFLIDYVPVVAVDQAQTVDDPVLAVLTSATFTDFELEEALAAGGHDPDEAMTVDGIVTDATSDAIVRWQESAGFPSSGLANPAYYPVMPTGQTVDAHLITEAGSSALRPVLTTSAAELRVEVAVAVADADEFAVDQEVSVELADENVVDGAVLEIGQVLRGNNQEDPTVTIVIGVLADANQDLVEGPVTVTTLSEVIEGATAIPTRSLVSLAEGGFAVEVVDDGGATRLVAVELGSFDDGYVEVTNGGVSVGETLVVPQ